VRRYGLVGCLLLVGRMACAQHVVLPNAPEPQPGVDTVAIVNGRPYQQPTQKELFTSYLHGMYGLWGMTSTSMRALYAEGRGKPEQWTGAQGFGQRFGSSEAVTVINGTVRYGMENVFREDLRYIPCHGCTVKHKIENMLLSEVTARHRSDGHRFFTLTPVVSDFSGPIITHAAWYPGASGGPMSGVIATRTVVATRLAVHAFREFALERRHHDPPERGPK
jgi:hypothetical protein